MRLLKAGLIFVLVLGWIPESRGQEDTPSIESGNASAPIENAAPSWREEYTFGPGDVINMAFFGKPELERPGLRIAPDGTLSYLQANSVPVAGKTIDQIREAFEIQLSKFYRNVRLIVTPGELSSKRYTILGMVVDKGVYVLDRPITILEAIARCRGVETGLQEQRTVEIADMRRSFIVRNGQQLPVDLSALYYRGDLSQNVELEPDDYIYIASNISNEFYVFGAVNMPGAQGITEDLTVVGAISRREGFTTKAWRARVLLVRGSIGNPEVSIVNVDDILKGRTTDVLVEPGDIVYVHERPWSKIEDILDLAINDFIRSATSTWIYNNTSPIAPEQWIPGL